jgi:hypothetical protein
MTKQEAIALCHRQIFLAYCDYLYYEQSRWDSIKKWTREVAEEVEFGAC